MGGSKGGGDERGLSGGGGRVRGGAEGSEEAGGRGPGREGLYLQLRPLHFPLGSLDLEAGPLVLQEVQDARETVLGSGRPRRSRPVAGRGSLRQRPETLGTAGARVVVAEEDAGTRLLVHGGRGNRGSCPGAQQRRQLQRPAAPPPPSAAPRPHPSQQGAAAWARGPTEPGTGREMGQLRRAGFPGLAGKCSRGAGRGRARPGRPVGLRSAGAGPRPSPSPSPAHARGGGGRPTAGSAGFLTLAAGRWRVVLQFPSHAEVLGRRSLLHTHTHGSYRAAMPARAAHLLGLPGSSAKKQAQSELRQSGAWTGGASTFRPLPSAPTWVIL